MNILAAAAACLLSVTISGPKYNTTYCAIRDNGNVCVLYDFNKKECIAPMRLNYCTKNDDLKRVECYLSGHDRFPYIDIPCNTPAQGTPDGHLIVQKCKGNVYD